MRHVSHCSPASKLANRPVPGDDEVRVEVGERLEHEAALVQARMRHRQPGLVDLRRRRRAAGRGRSCAGPSAARRACGRARARRRAAASSSSRGAERRLDSAAAALRKRGWSTQPDRLGLAHRGDGDDLDAGVARRAPRAQRRAPPGGRRGWRRGRCRRVHRQLPSERYARRALIVGELRRASSLFGRVRAGRAPRRRASRRRARAASRPTRRAPRRSSVAAPAARRVCAATLGIWRAVDVWRAADRRPRRRSRRAGAARATCEPNRARSPRRT